MKKKTEEAPPDLGKKLDGINEKKWGKPLIDAGWTLIPNVLVQRQKVLGLDAMDINILLHILTYWWKPGDLPHPSKVTIADAMGCAPRTVQRHIEQMEKDGYVKRVARQGASRGTQTNLYDLSGLIKAAAPYAKEALEMRSKREAEIASTTARKGRARLRVVETD